MQKKGCEMKALTMWEPWASLVAFGEKQYETRSWSTSHRGLLAIHAAKKFDSEIIGYCREFKHLLNRHGIVSSGDLNLGCVLAIVRVVDCVPSDKLRPLISEQERSLGGYDNGRYGWELKMVKRLEVPIPTRGYQGLWNWDAPDCLLEEIGNV